MLHRVSKTLFYTGALIAVFVLVRLPGLSHIYHQDEYKWAQIVHPAYGLQGTIPHPPLSEWLYHVTGVMFGYDWLRIAPLLFSVANLILGMVLVRRWFCAKSAILFGVLSSIITASAIASLQVDIDGALLPFWTLLAFYGASEWWERHDARRAKWFVSIACIGGLLTKVSFLLVPLTLLLEWIISRRLKISKRVVVLALGIGGALLLLWISPVLNELRVVHYAKSFGFLNFLQRDYFELLLLTMKSIVMVGPVCLVALVAVIRRASRYRHLLVFSALQFIFYFVLFDFTHRTMERYLLAFLFPIMAIASDEIVARYFFRTKRVSWRDTLPAIGITILWTSLLFLVPKTAIPLHPKEEFVRRVLHADTSFLIPISGGSGPIGFFVPADVTLVVFLATALLLFWGWRRPAFPLSGTLAIASLLFGFGVLTTQEFIFGGLYGNASAVAKKALAYVNAETTISKVITYNDIGGWELGESKKYFKRFYLNAEFASTNEKKFTSFQGHYLVIGMPPLQPTSPAGRYFERCKNSYSDQDKDVSGKVYDCRGVPYISAPSSP